MRTPDSQISLYIRTVWTGSSLYTFVNVLTYLDLVLKLWHRGIFHARRNKGFHIFTQSRPDILFNFKIALREMI